MTSDNIAEYVGENNQFTEKPVTEYPPVIQDNTVTTKDYLYSNNIDTDLLVVIGGLIVILFLMMLIMYFMNRPGFPGECFICELRLPDHCFRWRHNKLFLFLSEEYGPAFSVIVDCYTSPPTLVWPVSLLSGFSSSYGVLPPFCKDH